VIVNAAGISEETGRCNESMIWHKEREWDKDFDYCIATFNEHSLADNRLDLASVR